MLSDEGDNVSFGLLEKFFNSSSSEKKVNYFEQVVCFCISDEEKGTDIDGT